MEADLAAPIDPLDPTKYTFDDLRAKLERLQKIENLAEALIPFVKYFGVCGADLRATRVVAELMVLLGHADPATLNQQSTDQLISDTRRETLREVNEWLAGSRYPRMMLKGPREDMLRELQSMAEG